MPSSHGGGSSGGGGGGGGFSSHSGGSSGGSSGPRYSRNRPFPGAIRYVYIGPLGTQRYFYYAGIPHRTGNPKKQLIIFAVIAIIGLIFAIGITRALVPKKLDSSLCDATGVYYTDEAGVLTNTDAIIATMSAFYDKSGVEPYLYITTYANIPNVYKYSGSVTEDTMENYALRKYGELFDDEGHWLILFAVNETPSSNYDRWIWIDMAGDNTSRVVTDTVFEEFQKTLQRSLNVYPDSYNDAFVAAFDKATENTVEWNSDSIMPIGIVWFMYLVFAIILIGNGVSSYKQAKDFNDYCDYQERAKGQPHPDADVFSNNSNSGGNNYQNGNGYYNNQTPSGGFDDYNNYADNNDYDPNDDDGIRF